MECFFSSETALSLPCEILAEKDCGRVKTLFVKMAGDESGELVNTEESEIEEALSSELEEDVLSKESLDNSVGKLALILRSDGFLFL